MFRLPKVASSVLVICGILLPEALALQSEDYSSVSNYLSELGALGAPYSVTINYFGFLPVAAAIVALIATLWIRLPRNTLVTFGLICLMGFAVSYLGAFLFPCDSGCPATGTDRQTAHNLAGLIGYAGCVIGLFALYFGTRRSLSGKLPSITLLSACWTTFSIFMMFNPNFEDLRGVFQRLTDYPVFIWLSFAALMPLNRRNSNL